MLKRLRTAIENESAKTEDADLNALEVLDSALVDSSPAWESDEEIENCEDDESEDDEAGTNWFDSETKSFLVSMLVHLMIIVGLASYGCNATRRHGPLYRIAANR